MLISVVKDNVDVAPSGRGFVTAFGEIGGGSGNGGGVTASTEGRGAFGDFGDFRSLNSPPPDGMIEW